MPVDPRVHALVGHILGPCRPLGVLFYGSGLRQFDVEGLFDFYIVLDSLKDWPAGTLARLGNHLLPPNVFYAEHEIDGEVLRAKVAVITLEQFHAGALPGSSDTTLWARFCQPSRLVWVRDSQSADRILEVVRQCVMTAAGWSAQLGSGVHAAGEWWLLLFARTYRAELRVERSTRGNSLLQGQEERYARLLPLAWKAAGLPFEESKGGLSPCLSPAQHARAQRRWTRLARRGRWRNIARLVKAAFTFRDGAAYLAWKIERHSGFRLALSPYEARHPLICLPRLLWRARSIMLKGMRG